MSMATPARVQEQKHAASTVTGLPRRSLADAKARKNSPQQVVRGARAGDFTQTLCSQPQFLGKKFQLAVALRRVLVRDDQVILRCLQRLQMARAREKYGF